MLAKLTKLIIIASLLLSPSLLGQDIEEKVIQSLKSQISQEDQGMSDDPQFKDLSLDIDDEGKKMTEISAEQSEFFGYDFISRLPTSISATSDLPVPNDYVVSLNDELRVLISGSESQTYNLSVGLDGSILVPDIGVIQVAGDNIFDVRKRVETFIKKSLIGVDVDISLSSLSAKKISIVGLVKSPGTYLVNPFSTILGALAYSGGLEKNASLRNIILIRGEDRFSFDLYQYLIFGDRSNDIQIQQGDTILVQASSQFVDVNGEVIRPKKYEYLATDTFADLVAFSMGFTQYANNREIYVEKKVGAKLLSANIDLSQPIGNSVIERLTIPRQNISSYYGIRIKGKSVEELLIAPDLHNNFEDLVNSLKFSDNLYPFYATVNQTLNNGLVEKNFSISLYDKSTYSDISLSPNTEITFFSREEIKESQSQFKEKINFTSKLLAEDNELESIIYSKASSKKNSDQVANINNAKDEVEIAGELELIKKINLGDLKVIQFGKSAILVPLVGKINPRIIMDYFGQGEKTLLERVVTNKVSGGVFQNSIDTVFNSDEISQISYPVASNESFFIEINGQIRTPGIYSANLSMTISELYEIAGGLTENADTRGIVLIRNSIRERELKSIQSAKKVILDSLITQLVNPMNSSSGQITSILPIIELADSIDVPGRLAGNLAPNSPSSKSITLEDGDRIFIPAISKSISIIGEVLQPLAVTYNSNITVYDYIESSGNFTDYADKNGIYVIGLDGISKPISNRDLKKYKPLPGDTIVVPRNLDKLNTLPLISASVKIISDIAFAAASLNVLRN